MLTGLRRVRTVKNGKSPSINTGRILPVLFCILAAVALFNLTEPGGRVILNDLWPGISSEAPSMPELMVSVTPLDDTRYFIANYGSIYLYESDRQELSLMKPLGDFPYNPTGVFFLREKNLLFVANYTANNILVFDADLDEKTLSLRGPAISSPRTVSPENVWVSSDGAFLVCANYDGNSATAFDIAAVPARELWSTPIEWAHGVCMAGGHVYVTGLGARSIFELDPSSGRIQRTSGHIGWDAGKTEFLWPTSVNPFPGDRLIVSDAHNGFVTVVNRRSLKVERYFGGNGPSFRFFNMPYCAIENRGKLIVLSTFQKRILTGDSSTFMFGGMLMESGRTWQYLRNSGNPSIKRLGEGREEYVWEKGPHLELCGGAYLMGKGWLFPRERNQRIPPLIAQDNGSLFNNQEMLYFLDRVVTDEGFLLFSPQSRRAYLVAYGDTAYLLPCSISLDSWRIGNDLAGPGGFCKVKAIAREGKRLLEEIKARRLPSGLLAREDLHRIVFPSYADEEFQRRFSAAFRTAAGKEFYRAFSSSQAATELKAMAQRYYRDALQEKQLPLDEFLLVGMLTGYDSGKVLK
ncbi:MAG: hypothetical protein RDV48_12395 [Candidatus Eremiobacteraeota bacterium]|nr:hypothetical protein [Candidatus Eremiobacteraeota bacterium]